MPSKYDYPDPGTDPAYCDRLGRRGRAPWVPEPPPVTRERILHDLHKAMHEALVLTLDSPQAPVLALAARTLLKDLETALGLKERR